MVYILWIQCSYSIPWLYSIEGLILVSNILSIHPSIWKFTNLHRHQTMHQCTRIKIGNFRNRIRANITPNSLWKLHTKYVDDVQKESTLRCWRAVGTLLPRCLPSTRKYELTWHTFAPHYSPRNEPLVCIWLVWFNHVSLFSTWNWSYSWN